MLLLTKAKRPLNFKMLCGFNKHAVKLRMHKAAPYAFPIPLNQTCKQSNRSNRKVIDWSQLRCNSNSNRLKFFKCNSNSNRLKFYLLHLLLSIIFYYNLPFAIFQKEVVEK